jgi:hypothetical protein
MMQSQNELTSLEVIHCEMEMQLVAVKAQSRHIGSGNKRNGAIIV